MLQTYGVGKQEKFSGNLKCDICGKRCKSSHSLKMHYSIYHKIKQYWSWMKKHLVFNYKNKFFLCADLNAVLDSMMSKVWAEGIAKFCCNTCGKVMAEKRDMKRHLESHLDMSYSCDICKKVCTTSNALRKHYYMHHRSWKLDCWKWIKIIKSKPIFF